jgi:hypothetical protein
LCTMFATKFLVAKRQSMPQVDDGCFHLSSVKQFPNLYFSLVYEKIESRFFI